MALIRSKLEVAQYFGTTSLPLTKVVTKEMGCNREGEELHTFIRRKCMIGKQEQANLITLRMCDGPEELQWTYPASRKLGLDLAGQIKMEADVRRHTEKHDVGSIKIKNVIMVY